MKWVLEFEDLVAWLSSRSDCGTGPDGIPYSAWCFAPISAQSSIYNMYVAMLNGSRPSADFLDSKLIFPPKGKEDGDTESQCRRHPRKTRPLCLSGCDNKAVAALVAIPLSEIADVSVDQC